MGGAGGASSTGFCPTPHPPPAAPSPPARLPLCEVRQNAAPSSLPSRERRAGPCRCTCVSERGCLASRFSLPFFPSTTGVYKNIKYHHFKKCEFSLNPGFCNCGISRKRSPFPHHPEQATPSVTHFPERDVEAAGRADCGRRVMSLRAAGGSSGRRGRIQCCEGGGAGYNVAGAAAVR